MKFIQLLREIAAAIKAQNASLALDKLIELLQLFRGTPTEGQFKLLGAAGAIHTFSSNDDAVKELEAFCAEHDGKSFTAADTGELLKQVAAIVTKLLPLILAGL